MGVRGGGRRIKLFFNLNNCENFEYNKTQIYNLSVSKLQRKDEISLLHKKFNKFNPIIKKSFNLILNLRINELHP